MGKVIRFHSTRAHPALRRAFGQRLRELRRASRLSQERLGEHARLSGKFVGEVERGEKSVSLDSLAGIAAALAVTVRELVGPAATPAPTEADQVYAMVRKAPERMRRRAVQVLRAALA